MTEPIAYLRGRFVPASQAVLPVSDAGVVLGATVTELTRTFHHKPWRLREHLDRLQRSLRYTRMNPGLTLGEWEAISLEIVAHNVGLLREGEELGLIQFVTPGVYPTYSGMTGMAGSTGPTVCIHTFPLPFELWSKKMHKGQHLVTPSIRHVPPQCYDPKVKYRSRLHYYLADQEARLVDPEASALLLDLQGNLTETNGANFFLVEQGKLLSPTTVNTLPGVSRAMVIELAEILGIPFEERDVQPYQAINAEEAFTSSTPYCLMPVTRLNGMEIGNGSPGPVWRKLLERWSAVVGLDIDQQIHDMARRRTERMS